MKGIYKTEEEKEEREEDGILINCSPRSDSPRRSISPTLVRLSPVNQPRRDVADRNTGNYPPTLPSLPADWTVGN